MRAGAGAAPAALWPVLLVGLYAPRSVMAQNCTNYCCGSALEDEAFIACQELVKWGIATTTCNGWKASARTACEKSCGNCTDIAKAVFADCIISMQFWMSYNQALGYCVDVQEAFFLGRCPSVCETNATDCAKPDAWSCQIECGNYHGCGCSRARGTWGSPDSCVGDTVLQGEVPGGMGLQYSCTLIPHKCKNHWLPVTECGRYKHCAVNMCAVKNVTCPLTDSCQLLATCAPGNGECYYTLREDNVVCNDGKAYTKDDHCVSGICVGWEDKCITNAVACGTDNPCLEPTGTCDAPTGHCLFVQRAEGATCATTPGGFSDGHCSDGLCQRMAPDLCVVGPGGARKVCPALGECFEPSQCHNISGQCTSDFKPEGKPCNDGNNATVRDVCIDGACVGDIFAVCAFKKVGFGLCVGAEQLPLRRYFSDVREKAICEQQCSLDAQCVGYSYGAYLCNIHGTRRTRHPSPMLWGRTWLLENLPIRDGTDSSITGTWWEQGSHAVTCYRKATEGDPPEPEDDIEKSSRAVLACLLALIVLMPVALYLSVRGYYKSAADFFQDIAWKSAKAGWERAKKSPPTSPAPTKLPALLDDSHDGLGLKAALGDAPEPVVAFASTGSPGVGGKATSGEDDVDFDEWPEEPSTVLSSGGATHQTQTTGRSSSKSEPMHDQVFPDPGLDSPGHLSGQRDPRGACDED